MSQRAGVLAISRRGTGGGLADKAQLVRLADVFCVGPLMLWGGLRLGGAAGYTLALLGIATVVYNGRNYLEVRGQ